MGWGGEGLAKRLGTEKRVLSSEARAVLFTQDSVLRTSLGTKLGDHFCKPFRILFVRNVATLAKDYQA